MHFLGGMHFRCICHRVLSNKQQSCKGCGGTLRAVLRGMRVAMLGHQAVLLGMF